MLDAESLAVDLGHQGLYLLLTVGVVEGEVALEFVEVADELPHGQRLPFIHLLQQSLSSLLRRLGRGRLVDFGSLGGWGLCTG